MSYNIDVISVF